MILITFSTLSVGNITFYFRNDKNFNRNTTGIFTWISRKNCIQESAFSQFLLHIFESRCLNSKNWKKIFEEKFVEDKKFIENE